jgi:hypothetical protein
MSSSKDDRSFAPNWVSRDVGLDFEYMKGVFPNISGVYSELPDDIFVTNKTVTKRDDCQRNFDVITRLIRLSGR